MLNEFTELCEWSDKEFPGLPWRSKRTLYTTLVSEIMLQQTTVSTVLPRYPLFLKAFPNIQSLAAATEDQLRQAWLGLGYYRRAVNLLKAANSLQNGPFPSDEEELCAIPGIGPYTASAIRAIGHNLPALAVDANLKRVLSRYFAIDTPYEKGLDKDIRRLLENKKFLKVLVTCGARRFNEALMDLGREICKIRTPQCLVCPLNKNCQAYLQSRQSEFPVRLPGKKNKLTDLQLLRFITVKEDGILLYKKIKGEWLEGQWELPSASLSRQLKDFKQYPASQDQLPASEALKSSITKYRIANYPVKISREQILKDYPFYEERQLRFFPFDKLPVITTTSMKLLKREKIIP